MFFQEEAQRSYQPAPIEARGACDACSLWIPQAQTMPRHKSLHPVLTRHLFVSVKGVLKFHFFCQIKCQFSNISNIKAKHFALHLGNIGLKLLLDYTRQGILKRPIRRVPGCLTLASRWRRRVRAGIPKSLLALINGFPHSRDCNAALRVSSPYSPRSDVLL